MAHDRDRQMHFSAPVVRGACSPWNAEGATEFWRHVTAAKLLNLRAAVDRQHSSHSVETEVNSAFGSSGQCPSMKGNRGRDEINLIPEIEGYGRQETEKVSQNELI